MFSVLFRGFHGYFSQIWSRITSPAHSKDLAPDESVYISMQHQWNINPKASVLQHVLFFPSDKQHLYPHTDMWRSMWPECRYMWFAGWKSRVQSVGVSATLCAEWLMRGLWQPGLQSGLMGKTPCLPSSTLLGCLCMKLGITQVVAEQEDRVLHLTTSLFYTHFCPLSFVSRSGGKKGLMGVSVKEFDGLWGKVNRIMH